MWKNNFNANLYLGWILAEEIAAIPVTDTFCVKDVVNCRKIVAIAPNKIMCGPQEGQPPKQSHFADNST